MNIVDFTSALISAYNGFLSLLSPFFKNFFNLFFLALLVFAYATFVWKLHKFISTKNVLNLKLKQYNTIEHPTLAKIASIGLYVLEYIVIMPFLIFFWFAIFGLALTIFTNLQVNEILIVSTVIVAAIRITSYSNELIARQVAKLLPLTVLADSLLVPGFFSFERVLNNINQIPNFLSQIVYYLAFITLVEIILRLFDSFFLASNPSPTAEEITKYESLEE